MRKRGKGVNRKHELLGNLGSFLGSSPLPTLKKWDFDEALPASESGEHVMDGASIYELRARGYKRGYKGQGPSRRYRISGFLLCRMPS